MPSAPPVLISRLLLIAGALVAVVLLGAGPAAAHVEATADGPATPGGAVTVAFDAEAESDTAGIASVRAQLPAGVIPEWVSLVSAPAGWNLTRTADGYSLAGPALAPHTNAEFSIHIGQLPTDRSRLGFKTWVRYTDGHEDAWTEEATAADQNPKQPAPTITVPTAAPGFPNAAPSGAVAGRPTAPGPATQAADGGSGARTAGLVLLGVLVVLAAGVLVWYRRLRTRGQG